MIFHACPPGRAIIGGPKRFLALDLLRISVADDFDFSALDNSVWRSLTTGHRALARGSGRVRRYASDVSPLSGMERVDAGVLEELRGLTERGDPVALFTLEPVVIPEKWELLRTMPLDQMVCTRVAHGAGAAMSPLTEADVPAMLALTAATEPGPFLSRTIEMGQYLGIRAPDGRLAAMAGERLSPEGFTEVSAVCTDPAHRGRGYAAALVAAVAGRILGAGKIPFLHVTQDNPAKIVYRKVGFAIRRTIQLTVLTPR
jgi:GNAT superfamily N-acetyltransferase